MKQYAAFLKNARGLHPGIFEQPVVTPLQNLVVRM
jgi:hypothetical protein